MTTSEYAINRRAFIVWTILIIAACVIYFAGISHELIWYDEAISAAIANHSFSEIMSLMPYENHPPLYFILLHFTQMILGDSEWALRFISAVAAIGMVGLGAGPVRRLFGDRTAFAYAIVVLSFPVMLIYAHETRMYSLANFSVTATVLYGFCAARDGRIKDWIIFAITSLVAAYSHYYGLIAVTMAHIFILCFILIRHRAQLHRYLATAALILIAYSPWLVVLFNQTMRVNKTKFWIPPVSIEAIFSAVFRPFAYRELFPTPLPVVQPTMAVAFIISLTLIIFGVIISRQKQKTTTFNFVIMSLVVYCGTIFVAIIMSLISVPIFYSRYMVVLSGVFALLIGLGIGQLTRLKLYVATIVLLTILQSFTLKDLYTHQFNLPFKQVRQVLQKELKPGDLLITSDCFTVGPAYYYFPQAINYYSSNVVEAQRDEILRVMSPRLRYNQGLKELLASHKPFWSLTDSSGLSRNVYDILVHEPGWEIEGKSRTFTDPKPYSFLSFTLAKYVYTGRDNSSLKKGTLKLHLTGLKSTATVIAMLFTSFPPLDDKTPPYRYQLFSVTDNQVQGDINGLNYGEYALVVWQDENRNTRWDWKDGQPNEGVWILNHEKTDPKLGVKGFTFDVIKFAFYQPELMVTGKIAYPPFDKPPTNNALDSK
ncbi:MAG: glycosyltransferase family 39 protein [Deltaproteobacteria bacterium]|nr:glycosyltransferase family 39 protein [Deltaproteobacteria bacterium]